MKFDSRFSGCFSISDVFRLKMVIGFSKSIQIKCNLSAFFLTRVCVKDECNEKQRAVFCELYYGHSHINCDIVTFSFVFSSYIS
jgi:hypothetical protein